MQRAARARYALSIDCICGETATGFADGAWRLHVDRRRNGDLTGIASPSTPLDEDAYEPVDDGTIYEIARRAHHLERSRALFAMSRVLGGWMGELRAQVDVPVQVRGRVAGACSVRDGTRSERFDVDHVEP